VKLLLVTLEIIAILIASYLIGSITTGDVVARIKKVNLRGHGSGNVGATNAFRMMGSASGIIVLVGDALKGVIAVLLGNLIGKIPGIGIDLNIFAGICAIVGHNWPIFAGFKGGKGIAVTLGVVIAMTPNVLIVLGPVWVIVFVSFGYVSLASLIATFLYPFTVYWFYPNDIFKLLFTIIVAIMAIYRHKANIVRLVKGEEHKILYQKKKEPKG
jgi:glycerol-3-phosphate acyltransferase PlsY